MDEKAPFLLNLLIGLAVVGLLAGMILLCHGLWVRRQTAKWNRIAPPPSKRQTDH